MKRQISEFLSIQEAADAIGVSAVTLRNWHKTGKFIPHHITPSGHRVYTQEQIDELLNNKEMPIKDESNTEN